jgi:hypothetical protein
MTATAIDANVAIALERGAPSEVEVVVRSLSRIASDGAIVVSGPVFAELCAGPAGSPTMERLLTEARISIVCDLTLDVWRAAGLAFRTYAERRRSGGAGEPRRILADFIIGAHACTVGTLVTNDAAFFRRAFPTLRVIDPWEEAFD